MTFDSMPRRTFLALTASGIASRAFGFAEPVTGTAHPDLAPFDILMTSFVEQNKVPGASLAVTRGGKLVYARGFGFSDVENKEAVLPESLFRIASVSKPLTAVAILQLAEKGKLKLDDLVMDHLKVKSVAYPNSKFDERWKKITIRHCLQHTGGWDRDKSFDPIVRALAIAKALKIEPPVGPDHLVQYMLGQPLDFDPGESYAYSNLGYLVLSRILETITGQKYEAHMKKVVLEPLGIKKARLGRALAENRAKGEVKYYDAKNRMGPGLYPPMLDKQVPIQYGASNLEAYEAHGGWIASSVELVKFASAFDDSQKSPLLSAKSIAAMWAAPTGEPGHDKDGKPKASFYGCGWQVRPIGTAGKANTWHTGYIPGSEAILVRRSDGLNWAVLFNTANNPDGKSLAGLIDGKVHEAANEVKRWPTVNLFAKYL